MRARKYSIVIHNVNPQDEKYWVDVSKTLKAVRVVTSVEEYPKTPGHYHAHIFIEFLNARSLLSVVKVYDNFKQGHVLPCDDLSKTPGRVQVDVMKGSFEEATAYLTAGQSKKDKLFGNVNDVRPHEAQCSLCNRVQSRYTCYFHMDICLCRTCHSHYRELEVPILDLRDINGLSNVSPVRLFVDFFSQARV